MTTIKPINSFKTSLTLVLLLLVFTAHATTQIQEVLIIGSDTLRMNEYPLQVKIAQDSNLLDPLKHGRIQTICSNCWRGYVGWWKVINDSLFLEQMRPCSCTSEMEMAEFELSDFFDAVVPGRGVFADWYTDRIFATKNAQLANTHQLILHVANGRVIKYANMVPNGPAAINAEHLADLNADLPGEKPWWQSFWFWFVGCSAAVVFAVFYRKMRNSSHI